MMRNHKIVSTVNAPFLLGFVAQRIFTLFFFHLTISSFRYPTPELLSTSFRTTPA